MPGDGLFGVAAVDTHQNPIHRVSRTRRRIHSATPAVSWEWLVVSGFWLVVRGWQPHYGDSIMAYAQIPYR